MDLLEALRLREILSLAESCDDDDQSSSSYLRIMADVVDTPTSYVLILDMPGMKRDQIRVHVENNAALVISGERKRKMAPQKAENDKKGKDKKKATTIKYISSERRIGTYLRKFVLPEDGGLEKVSAVYEDRVLTVTVEKRPLPPPTEPKTTEVKVA